MSIERESMRLLSGRHRPLTISLIAAIALVSYNNLAVTAALPAISDSLGNVSLVPWVITVELLAAAIAVLGFGPVVDSRGVRLVFRLSMVGFILFSLLCALAPSMIVLILARIGQGVASGGVIGSAVSTIGLAYDESLRPRAFATVSAVWGVMGIGGPAIAAVLISVFGWRSIFSISVPIGLVATAIGWRHLPGRRDGSEAAAFDGRGLSIVGSATVCLLVAASTSSVWGLVWFVGALVLISFYLHHARGNGAPVVRVEHLVGRRWRYLHLASTLAVVGGTGASAYLPLYLRGARDASEGEAAFSVLFLVVGWSTASFISSKAQERVHAAYVVRAGTIVLITATVATTAIAAYELALPVLMAGFVLVGAGIGSVTTSGISMLQSRAADAEMGRVSSAHQFVRSLGFSYGAAIGGAVLFFVVARQIGDVEAVRELLSDADANLDGAAAAALQDGYVWALGTTALFTLISGAAAIKLVSSIGRFTADSAVVQARDNR